MHKEKYKWLEKIFATNEALANIQQKLQPTLLGQYLFLTITPEFWLSLISSMANLEARLVALWVEDLTEYLQITAGFVVANEYLFLRCLLDQKAPEISSITPLFPAANRLERHMRDMYGVQFIGHPDKRRWIIHKAWNEKQFPLRKNFPSAPLCVDITPPDNDYPFVKASGLGIYEIPVGPVHAGIIEPGHFRFQVAGEEVINLEEHLGYVHKGIEKIAEGREVFELSKLAARVSGDSTVAYTWSACMACENAMNLEVPNRAKYLRAIMAERERIANHLGDFAAVCNDVGFAAAYYQLMRLKELWLRVNKEVFGHRLLMDCIIPGGVLVDITAENISAMQQQISALKKELEELYPIFEANSSLHDRLKNTGILSKDKARQLGVLGYVSKASGIKFDLRHDAPYFPYDKIKVKIPVFNNGDVLSRVRVRAQEILVSLELLEEFLQILPEGAISTCWHNPTRPVAGIGIIEGWRGEVFTYVSLDSHGLVERYFPRDPSWFAWPALEELIHGNIVPDFPVCNKSINGSYSAVDL